MRLGVRAIVAALCFAVSDAPVGAMRSSGSNPDLKADAVMPVRTHSLFPPYVDSTLQNNYWDYGGDAIIDTNRYVMLTQDRRNESGWLWSRLPIEASDFEITAEFALKGRAPQVVGDGFAMWLTSARTERGPAFGLQEQWKGLAIIFDTYANAPHRGFFPRISAVYNDGTMVYNVQKDGEGQDLAQCSMQLRRTPAETRLRFTYVKDVYMELAIQNMEWNKWSTCFKLPPVEWPSAPFLGFSASTGDLHDSHNIVSVWTNRLVYNERSEADLAAERKLAFAEQERQGWWTLGKDAHKAPAPLRGEPADAVPSRSLIGSFVAGVGTLLKWAVILALLAAAGWGGYRWYLRRARGGSFKTRRMMA